MFLASMNTHRDLTNEDHDTGDSHDDPPRATDVLRQTDCIVVSGLLWHAVKDQRGDLRLDTRIKHSLAAT